MTNPRDSAGCRLKPAGTGHRRPPLPAAAPGRPVRRDAGFHTNPPRACAGRGGEGPAGAAAFPPRLTGSPAAAPRHRALPLANHAGFGPFLPLTRRRGGRTRGVLCLAERREPFPRGRGEPRGAAQEPEPEPGPGRLPEPEEAALLRHPLTAGTGTLKITDMAEKAQP